MKTCSICSKEIAIQDPAVLFISRWGNKREICEDCEKHMDTLVTSENPAEVQEEKDYFYNKVTTDGKNNCDEEVIEYLNNLFAEDENTIAEAKEAVETENELPPESEENKKDEDENESKNKAETPKVSLRMRIITTVIFLVIAGAITAFGIINNQTYSIVIGCIIALIGIASFFIKE